MFTCFLHFSEKINHKSNCCFYIKFEINSSFMLNKNK